MSEYINIAESPGIYGISFLRAKWPYTFKYNSNLRNQFFYLKKKIKGHRLFWIVKDVPKDLIPYGPSIAKWYEDTTYRDEGILYIIENRPSYFESMGLQRALLHNTMIANLNYIPCEYI